MADIAMDALEAAAAWLAGIVAVLLAAGMLIGVVLICERDDSAPLAQTCATYAGTGAVVPGC